MGVPTSEVGYTSAMPKREDHEVHKGHVVALGRKKNLRKSRFSGLAIQATGYKNTRTRYRQNTKKYTDVGHKLDIHKTNPTNT